MSTLYLPAWSIGPDCYKEVYEIVRPYGKKVAVIGGHTALSVAMPKLKAALEGFNLEDAHTGIHHAVDEADGLQVLPTHVAAAYLRNTEY